MAPDYLNINSRLIRDDMVPPSRSVRDLDFDFHLYLSSLDEILFNFQLPVFSYHKDQAFDLISEFLPADDDVMVSRKIKKLEMKSMDLMEEIYARLPVDEQTVQDRKGFEGMNTHEEVMVKIDDLEQQIKRIERKRELTHEDLNYTKYVYNKVFKEGIYGSTKRPELIEKARKRYLEDTEYGLAPPLYEVGYVFWVLLIYVVLIFNV